MVTPHDLLAEIRLAFACAHTLDKVLREGVQRVGLVARADGRVEFEPLETRLDFDFRDRQAPEREARQEGVPVFRRD